MYCTACGKEIPRPSRFCPFCGAPLDGAPVPGEVQRGAPAPGTEETLWSSAQREEIQQEPAGDAAEAGVRTAAANPAETALRSAEVPQCTAASSRRTAPIQEEVPDFDYRKRRVLARDASPQAARGGYGPDAGAASGGGIGAAAWHFFKWTLAVLGVLAAFIALEYAALYGFLFFELALGVQIDDDGTIMGVVVQVVWMLVALPWLLHVNRRGIGRERPRQPFDARRVVGVVLIGLGLQVVVSLAVTVILSFFPAIQESYSEMMEDSETHWLLDFISTAFLAPLSEEPYFRGLAMQFALRAVCLGWSAGLAHDEYGRLRVTPARFWVANVLQAAVFGVAHLNITQGLYTFVCALVFGWLWWRTGQLRWPVLVHLVLNLSSYFLSEMLDVLSLFGGIVGEIALPCLFVVFGIRLFKRATAGTDPYRIEPQRAEDAPAAQQPPAPDPSQPPVF